MSNRSPSGSVLSLIFITALLTLIIVGCEQYTSPSPVFSTGTPTIELSPTPSITLTTSPTPQIYQQNGLLILSIEENGFAHLFAYSPGKFGFTRLTYGDWSDITPSLSPDGKSVAFSSNRGGYWDLYTLDLQSGQVSQLTNTPEFDSSPSWSPDLAYIAYDTYRNGTLNISILSLTDPGQKPIILTDDPASDHSPAWAPNGRQIAFISNRSGDDDVWLADLNKTDGRFTDLSNTPQASESHPVWSPDGLHLAWASSPWNNEYNGIYVWNANHPDQIATWLGDGTWPSWNADSNEIVTAVDAPNQQLLSAYNLNGDALLLPVTLPGPLDGLIWSKLSLPDPLPKAYQVAAVETPGILWSPALTPIGGVPANRWYVVPIQNVQAPYPQLHALVANSFVALRHRVIEETGWDALASLENAYVPLTTALDPGLGEDWLYTGRAIAINSLMINAGWMAVVREDVGEQTFWRLFLRAQNQDGSQGQPIESPPWDLNARYDLNPITYEAGGGYTSIPPGYWVDFTSIARAYGWERLPALPNWRNYYAGGRFTEFASTGGLDWYAAMTQLYPAEALITSTPLLPPSLTPSITPIPSSTPGPSRTPRATLTASKSPTPRPPTNTPLPTPTPPTIIPTFKP